MNKARKHHSKLTKKLLDKRNPVTKQQTATKMQIAVKLDDAIRAKGWTNSKLAKELGIDRSNVTRWLSGTYNFTIDSLVQLCYVLDVELASLLLIDRSTTTYYRKGRVHPSKYSEHIFYSQGSVKINTLTKYTPDLDQLISTYSDSQDNEMEDSYSVEQEYMTAA